MPIVWACSILAVRRFVPRDGAEQKVPHMGWNTLRGLQVALCFDGIGEGSHVYFVHSYYAPVSADCAWQQCDYIHSVLCGV